MKPSKKILKKTEEPTRNIQQNVGFKSADNPETESNALLNQVNMPALQGIPSTSEISHMKLLNKKFMFDSKIKCDIIKKLTNENFGLKNEIIQLNEEIKKLKKKLSLALSVSPIQNSSNNQQATLENASLMTSTLNSFFKHTQSSTSRVPTFQFKPKNERIKYFNFQGYSTCTNNTCQSNTCASEEEIIDLKRGKLSKRGLKNSKTHAAISIVIPESVSPKVACITTFKASNQNINTQRGITIDGISSPIDSSGLMRHYDNFKLNSNYESFKGDSFLSQINGQIPLTKYSHENCLSALEELKSMRILMSSFSNFVNQFSSIDVSKKEKLYYDLKCIINDFKYLVENLFVSNNLLRAQQRFNENRSIDEMFETVEKVCTKIMNCSRVLFFLYDIKNDEYYTLVKRTTGRRYIRISGKEGFAKNLRSQEKSLVIDQAFSQVEFTSGFKLVDKELDIKTMSLMLSPVFVFKPDTGDQTINDKGRRLSTKYNKNFYRKQAGFLMFINKKDTQQLHHFNPSGGDSLLSPSKSKFSQEDFMASVPSFNIDDESVAGILTKQISNLLDIVYCYQNFSNKEYKLNKTLELIQRLSTDNKKSFISHLISTIKKLFLTDKVQVVVTQENGSFLRVSDEKDGEFNKLEGILSHVYVSKQPIFTSDAKNSMMYNPMFDIDGCDTIYTAPILLQIDNNTSEIKGIIQLEYIISQAPWEDGALCHSLTSFDNDLLEVLLPTISNAL